MEAKRLSNIYKGRKTTDQISLLELELDIDMSKEEEMRFSSLVSSSLTSI